MRLTLGLTNPHPSKTLPTRAKEDPDEIEFKVELRFGERELKFVKLNSDLENLSEI